MARILVVDDEAAVSKFLRLMLEAEGHEVCAAAAGPDAVAIAGRVRPEVALVDVRLPGCDGFAVAARCHARDPHLPVILFTGQPSIEESFAAGRAGIVAYLEKPVRKAGIVEAIDAALHPSRRIDAAGEAGVESEPGSGPPGFEGLIGASAVMQAVFRFIERVAPLEETILVLGETGTGKDLVARAIHARSLRRAGPFVAVNCAAYPDTLFETEFFRHERGAYTDAREAAPGLFEQAAGGTLFLDEVGELSLGAQAKLLRAVETREITRVGGTRSRRVDVRLVAATNADLSEDVRRGAFRRDLHARLSGFVVTLPPLRDRGADLDFLIDACLARVAPRMGRAGTGLSPAARAVLRRYRWPGNVRDIDRVLKHALLGATGEIGVNDLPGDVLDPTADLRAEDLRLPEGLTLQQASRQLVARAEAAWIAQALAAHGGNASEAARALGIHRGTLARKLHPGDH